jgi:beta-lactamase regulating signal transducer with metallopeptidase domain
MLPGSIGLLPLIGSAVHAVNVVLAWLMTYAIHSTILIGSLLLLTSTDRGRRLVAGHASWLWRFALVGALITSSLQSWRSVSPMAGTLRVDGDTPARTTVRVEIRRENVVAPASGTVRTRASHSKSVASSIDVSPTWPIILFGAWALLAAVLLARFLVARTRFMRTMGQRTSATHTLAGNSLRHLLRESRLARDVRLTVSDRLTSPVALSADEICLPSRALSELDPVRIESILAHELAHLVRRDPAWLTIARVIEAIFFFQPLNVLARRRMQESAEFASDAWASTRVARPLDLAHCLARVAEWTIAAPRLPVPAMAEGQGPGRRGAVLVRRVERLTTGRVIPEVVPGHALRLAGAALLFGLILLAPRAGIGADVSERRHVFNARTSGSEGVLLFRRSELPPAERHSEKQVQAVLFRVQSR